MPLVINCLTRFLGICFWGDGNWEDIGEGYVGGRIFSGQRYEIVGDCGLLSCPPMMKFVRARKIELPMKPLLNIAFVTISCFIFLVILFHFCDIFSVCRVLGRQALLKVLVLVLAGATCQCA
jgi:hypothetical protein